MYEFSKGWTKHTRDVLLFVYIDHILTSKLSFLTVGSFPFFYAAWNFTLDERHQRLTETSASRPPVVAQEASSEKPLIQASQRDWNIP